MKTQSATYPVKVTGFHDSIDQRSLELFLVNLSNNELHTLENLLAARLAQNKLAADIEFTEVEEKSLDSLTPRESQVLTLIASGYTRPEVAKVLGISRNTAATHIASIYRKLDVRSIAEATMYAYRRGLVS